MRVLIVEDHDETRELLAAALRDEGHVVVPAADLADARDRLAGGRPDVVVLDWMLPDGEGVELCRELRAAADATPVLLLTARGDVDDRVRGLDAGADDYLRKPFAVAELRARVRALARRGPRLELPVVRIGDLEIRPAERRVSVAGAEVPLTAREFSILEVLLRRRGAAVSRADILESVWGEVSPGTEASLEVLVGRLRRKLAAGDHEPVIRTHRGLGYSVRFGR